MDDDLMRAAKNAAAVIGSIYEWLDRVEKAGGATSISGIASCNAMLKSLRKNADRTEQLVEAERRKREALRQQALRKLTKEERDALDLKAAA